MKLFLKHIDFLNFKNFAEVSLNFTNKINCFAGSNGSGKTNLLDAIYYLSFCKSYFSSSDIDNIKRNDNFFVINGSYDLEETEENIFCGVKLNSHKQFKRNKKEYSRLADHIGFIPLVIVSPYDTNLISDGSDERRKFLNNVISQYDKIYLNNILNYNRLLKQRNILLKDFYQKKHIDFETLEVFDEKMATYAQPIYQVRNNFIENLIPVFKEFYNRISGESENIDIIYQSQLENENLLNLLKNSIEKDNIMQYTTCGIHKDDLIFKIDDFPIKTNGSQGQQKSFLLSLKLAQFDFIKQKNNVLPILLLDDIFDKLDNFRVAQLMQLVGEHHFGQIFITDTDKQRIERVLEPVKSDYSIFNLEKGEIL